MLSLNELGDRPIQDKFQSNAGEWSGPVCVCVASRRHFSHPQISFLCAYSTCGYMDAFGQLFLWTLWLTVGVGMVQG